MKTAAALAELLTTPPAKPKLKRGEPLRCVLPECGEPIDPAVWPYHPDHDITPAEWEAIELADQARAARADAVQQSQLRALVRTTPRSHR